MSEQEEFEAILKLVPLDDLWLLRICDAIENFSIKHQKQYSLVMRQIR